MTAAGLASRARRLTAFEWRVLVESAVLALVVETALRVTSLARILRAVERPVTATEPIDRAAAGRIARLSRWPWRLLPLRSTCLRVALVQVMVLRRRQLPAVVRFGVRRATDGELEFHAWADCGGPLEDESAAAYRAFEPAAVAAITRSARWSSPGAPPPFEA